MPGPIKPKEVQKRKNEGLPEEVFEVFNSLIVAGWDGSSATVRQDTAVERISKALQISRQEVFDRRLLDVENAYRKAGWKVQHDKPSIGDSYEAYFVFRKS